MASSTLQGLLTWPEMRKKLVPVLVGGTPFLPQGFQKRGLLATDIGADPVVDDDIEIRGVKVVLADQACLVSSSMPPVSACVHGQTR
jgi:hypothetical protein